MIVQLNGVSKSFGTQSVLRDVGFQINRTEKVGLIGVKTFGMGSVQKLIPLDGGYGLLISTAKYYTPGGKEIQDAEPQDSGIKPTIEVRQTVEETLDLGDDATDVPPPPKEPSKEEDRQLNKAIEILKDPSKISEKKAA